MEVAVAEPVQEGESQGPIEVEDEWEADLHYHDKRCRKNPGHSNFIPIDQFNVDHLPPGCQNNDLVDLVQAVADLTVRLTVKYVSEKRPETFPGTDKPYPMYDKRGSNTTTVGTGCVSRVKKYPYKPDNICFDQCLNSPMIKIVNCRQHLKSLIPKTCNCKECLTSPTPKTQFAQIYIYTATHVVFDHLEAAHTTCHLFFDSCVTPALCSGVVTLTEPSIMFTDINSDLCYFVFVTHDLELADKLESMVEQCRRSHLINYKNLPLGSEKLSSSSEEESVFDDLCLQSTFVAASDNLMTKIFQPHLFDAAQNCLPDMLEDQDRRTTRFLQQMRNMTDESEEDISLPAVESLSDFVEEEMHPSKDWLCQRIGANVESENLGYQQESAEAKSDSMKHLDGEGDSADVAVKHVAETVAGCTSYFLEKKILIEKLLLHHKSSMNDDKGTDSKEQVIHSLLGNASDMLANILNPVKHLLHHESSMNADTGTDSKEQVLQSIVGSTSDIMEKTMHSVTKLFDLGGSIDVGSDERRFTLEKEPFCDLLTGLSHLMKQLGSKEESTSRDLESLSGASKKFMFSYRPVFESLLGDMKNESEKQRSQTQTDHGGTLTIIVSHPHGCSKQVTIGQYTNCDERNDVSSKFKYNTPTCPGSSGARVCVVGRNSLLLSPHHAHSGGSKINQENFSASGLDIPLD